jgi:TRAP-type mannitol/chloroaromatic compound transport system permease small subunit
VQQSYNIGEGSPDPGGLTHRWILKAMIPAGFALLLVQSLAALLRAFVSLVTGQPIRRPGDDERGVEHAA